jgi:MFS family permease
MLMINTVNATVQANVSDALRGRVMALYVTVFAGSAPLGSLFAGVMAEAFGTPAAFLAGAALSAITLAITALGLRNAQARGSLGVTTIDSSSKAPDPRGADPRPASAAR